MSILERFTIRNATATGRQPQRNQPATVGRSRVNLADLARRAPVPVNYAFAYGSRDQILRELYAWGCRVARGTHPDGVLLAAIGQAEYLARMGELPAGLRRFAQQRPGVVLVRSSGRRLH